MLLVRRVAVPTSKIKDEQPLIGIQDGVNKVFTTGVKFVHTASGIRAHVFWNGQRLVEPENFAASESGGVGTGYDTLTLETAPVVDDMLRVDIIEL